MDDRPQSKTGYRVLVVDYDGLSQLVAVRMPERHGMPLLWESCKEAVAALEKSDSILS
jgi:hypothetical protein